MKTYWMKFTDGSDGNCQGQNAYDAVRIAEHFTGKTVDVGEHKYSPEKSENVKSLPYPAGKTIWKFNHPIFGETPSFCFGGAECRGRGSCPAPFLVATNPPPPTGRCLLQSGPFFKPVQRVSERKTRATL